MLLLLCNVLCLFWSLLVYSQRQELQFLLFFALHMLGRSSSIPLFWAYAYPCMWDGFSGYSAPMGFGFLSSLPVCVFWLGHLAYLHLRLILLCVNLILPFWCQLVVLPISWHGFLIVSMLFTICYVFGVAGTGCSFLCLVLLSGDLIKQAWWWWNLWEIAFS